MISPGISVATPLAVPLSSRGTIFSCASFSNSTADFFASTASLVPSSRASTPRPPNNILFSTTSMAACGTAAPYALAPLTSTGSPRSSWACAWASMLPPACGRYDAAPCPRSDPNAPPATRPRQPNAAPAAEPALAPAPIAARLGICSAIASGTCRATSLAAGISPCSYAARTLSKPN